MFDSEKLDNATRTLLENHGFASIPFANLAARLLSDGLDPERNRIAGAVELPASDAIFVLPAPEEAEAARLAQLGEEAIAAGEVGVVILNGGMATRFGGVAKGAAGAVAGRSFLDLKLTQVACAGDGKAPALLMNSFATERATADHLGEINPQCEVRQFSQMVSLRLTPKGDVFFDDDGKPSLHAPGHGDLPFALVRSGELQRFIRGGGRYLTVSNVDNLAASLDPTVIGAHIDSARPMTVELVETHPGDVGGFPALVNGRMAIVEAFRIPRSFDVDTIPVFNTNTFVFDAAVLAEEFALDWFAVTKKVDGRDAVQFERLAGQLTEFVEVTWLRVPREGANSRFIPIKVPADLEKQAASLDAVLRAQGVL